ncbi:uracil-DNA glycosylase, family 4 [Candidatus Nitrosopumilus salaria BD31]|uniref:Type-5 uracil-DNA glycosylase n=1 Tax=Candidatus Nitrosopumilus salarius BD31 TaxID=859350 RepID=I3D0I1_9ARCH|nr:uracil-DNA glycosylase [Candidatus Nitrosopumilus salaria]EIJ65224.1 uracil-DNA glycosylase, family 4 [Candidatus Nitrosopumilus salaria BD31]
MKQIESLNKKIASCKKCPRLSVYIRDIAKNKVRRFKDEKYYGKPLSGFGDINAKLLIVGLAPAAHGGNRTGRMFTGDSSGDWLAKAMHRYGFASIPTSQNIHDGLVLKNAYITATVRCAPPQNKPSREEMQTCFEYLVQEKEILKNITTVLCLGKIAYDASCKLYKVKSEKFGHNKLFRYDKIKILTSYHPSKQNTQTGRLTWSQWSEVFQRAKRLTR